MMNKSTIIKIHMGLLYAKAMIVAPIAKSFSIMDAGRYDFFNNSA